MQRDWFWDRNISRSEIKKIFSNAENPRFIGLAALLLSRKNSAKEAFADYIKREDFFIYWHKIKSEMRKNSWNDPRIEYWQAIYDTLRKNPKFAKLNKSSSKEPASKICQETGEKIRQARVKSNLTQGQLAERMKVSQQIISRIESGRQNLSLETLESIASALGFSLNIELK